MFYSPSTGGFYDSEIHGSNIPFDSVEISDDHYQSLLEGQSDGKFISSDSNGNPILQDHPFIAQSIQSEIDALERNQLMPRATREFMLLSMESQFTPAQLLQNPGYQAVKEFDNQIVALRALL